MAKKDIGYAVNNQAVYDQYYATDNVVTRWSLLQILENRLDAGDEDADSYVYAIKHTKELMRSRYDET